MSKSGDKANLVDRVQRAGAWLRARVTPVARFGSPASMTLGAALGVMACAGALASWPADGATAAIRAVSAPIALTPVSAPQAVGAPPPPPLQLALDYEVAFFWPKTPQTVSEPVAIREGPSEDARAIRSARPGERLRINGRVDDAPDGPWLRVRLDSGRDGYFAARTIDVGAYRRPPPAAPVVDPATSPDGVAPDGAAGAPLFVAGPAVEPDGPPSF
jgi:hypothetical protein